MPELQTPDRDFMESIRVKFGQNIMIVLIISIDLIDVKVGIHPLT